MTVTLIHSGICSEEIEVFLSAEHSFGVSDFVVLEENITNKSCTYLVINIPEVDTLSSFQCHWQWVVIMCAIPMLLLDQAIGFR